MAILFFFTDYIPDRKVWNGTVSRAKLNKNKLKKKKENLEKVFKTFREQQQKKI